VPAPSSVRTGRVDALELVALLGELVPELLAPELLEPEAAAVLAG
jgi:hypothetical protein